MRSPRLVELSSTRGFVPLTLFLIVAIPIGVIAAFLAIGQRDGITMDRLVLTALRQRVSPRYRVTAPEGVHPAPEWLTHQVNMSGNGNANTPHSSTAVVSPAALRLPAEAVTDTGVIDLGNDGVAVVAVCSTINFGLRTPAEQEALVASFGRYLHSLTAPVQVLIRAERLDLSGQVAELREQAGGLPYPALEQAAREHAEYLDQLGRATELNRHEFETGFGFRPAPVGVVDIESNTRLRTRPGSGSPVASAVGRCCTGGRCCTSPRCTSPPIP
ncbi:hypothetical protein LX90_004069 [Lentzea flava]|nr:hypothetical protein [Lentzea flava]